MHDRRKPQAGRQALAANVARLSALLTRERESLPSAYLRDKGLRDAYLAYFLPANIGKIAVPLRELALHPDGLLAKARLRILDLGSGPGSAVFGAVEWFLSRRQRPELDFVAVDQVPENLNAAEELFLPYRDRYGRRAALTTVRSSLEHAERVVQGTFDIVILSNVLNELGPTDQDATARKIGLLRTILDRFLGEHGSCIIIEPALRETSRGLLHLRDELLAGGVSIYSPCLAPIPCPALVSPKDWCHEDIAWDGSPAIRELDRLTGLRKDSLKFSYLVLRLDNRSVADVYGHGAFRVVSEPLVSKGKIEFYLCGASGRRLATRLDKDENAKNAPFGSLNRGEVVLFDRLLDEQKRFRIGPETVVIRKGV